MSERVREEATPRSQQSERSGAGPAVPSAAERGSAGPSFAALLAQSQRRAGNRATAQLARSLLFHAGARAVQREVERGRLNVVGEDHHTARREDEMKALAAFGFGEDQYWTEEEFTYGERGELGDSPSLRMLHSAVELYRSLSFAQSKIAYVLEPEEDDDPRTELEELRAELAKPGLDPKKAKPTAIEHDAEELKLDIDRGG